MKQFFFATIAALAATNCLFANIKSTDLDYILQRKDSTSLLITVSFNGNNSGKTILHLPNEAAGQQMLYKAVSLLHAVSKTTFIDTTSKPDNYLVRYQPGSKVTISYILNQGWAGPLHYPFYNRPVIRNNFIYFEGCNGLVYPDMDDRQPISCKISYKRFSKRRI
jgi:hypothetical protein